MRQPDQLQNLVEIPVVDALSRIPASREREGQFVRIAAIPGTSAAILYMCLADNVSPSGYAWVEVAINGQFSDRVILTPHVECFISTPAATTISDTTSFFQVNGTFTLSVVGNGFTVDGGGQITYTGTRKRMMHIFASFGVSSGTNNQTLDFAVRKNGVAIIASIISRKVAVANDVGSSALHSMFTMETGDTVDTAVRNISGSNDVTFGTLNLGLMAMYTDMTGVTVP